MLCLSSGHNILKLSFNRPWKDTFAIQNSEFHPKGTASKGRIKLERDLTDTFTWTAMHKLAEYCTWGSALLPDVRESEPGGSVCSPVS